MLEIVENPEKYTPERLKELLSDPETKEIYTLLSKTSSAMTESEPVDVDEEWKRFATEHPAVRRMWLPSFMRPGSRAASVAAILLSSMVAVAVGIAVTVSVIDRKNTDVGIAASENMTAGATSEVTLTEVSDTLAAPAEPVLFEDAPLEEIMQTIGRTYGLKVRFEAPETAELHLFYKFDPQLSVEEVIGQLNTFEQIKIAREGQTLIVK
ncbi:MAG: DUF4974 domain-containing protein [Duncaniella sp.]|nr:DUF4974 domain-containing protein [Duncaniella sp.]